MPVYFIRAGEDGPVKIGTAKSVEGRLSALQTGNPIRLLLLRQIAGDGRAEKWLHGHFADLRMQGEWFLFSEEMLSVSVPSGVSRVGSSTGLRRYTDVVNRWKSAEQLAADVGVSGVVARAWRNRDGIPSHKWARLVEAAQRRGFSDVTVKTLADIAERRANHEAA